MVNNNISWGGVIVYNEKSCGFCFDCDDIGEHCFGWGWGEGQESFPEESWEIVGSFYG